MAQFVVQIDTALRRGLVEHLADHLLVGWADGVVHLLQEPVWEVEKRERYDIRNANRINGQLLTRIDQGGHDKGGHRYN